VKGDFAPELKEAIARILKAAQDAGKKSGIYCPNGEFARKYADDGFQMISVTNDMTALPTFMAESLSKAKGSWVHSAGQAVKGAAYASAGLMSQDKKS
jgi:4-hydroxy-2-oxoheptanedioate aldolase